MKGKLIWGIDIDQVEVDLALNWMEEIKGNFEGKKELEGDDNEGEIFVTDFWEDEEWEEAWDDVKGGSLPIGKVREARREEVGFMHERKLWDLRPIKECWEKTGRKPTTVKWVDTDKGEGKEVIVRSRSVARDFKGMIRGGTICLPRRLLLRRSGC